VDEDVDSKFDVSEKWAVSVNCIVSHIACVVANVAGPEPVTPGLEGFDTMSAVETKHREFARTKKTAELVVISLQTVIRMEIEPPNFEVTVVTGDNSSCWLLGINEVFKLIAEKTKMRV
jgi:hypothetical protein